MARWTCVAVFLLGLTMSVAADSSVRIGNFYYNAPNGIAFIKDDAAAFVLDPGGSYNAGVVAPDDSYHQVFLSNGDNYLIDFQWSRVGDAVVARLESQRAEKINFTLDKNWPEFSSKYSASVDGVTGVAKAGSNEVTWKLQAKPAPESTTDQSVVLPLGGPGKPTYFVAGFGELPSFDQVEAILIEARKNYEQHRPRADGPAGDIVGAITNNLNNSRVYSTDNHKAPITVSRTFGVSHPNTTPYFCWDSFFNGLLASIDNPESAKDTVRAILAGQSADGLVPNFTHWAFDGGGTSTDRSQPPVGSMCIWKMHLRHPDPDFLREVYPKLVKWHAWWLKARNPKKDGLLCWGTNLDKMDGPLGTLQGALWETGWDDTPHFRDVPGVKMVGHTMNVYAVDLCSLWAMDAHYLALMADALGNKDDAEKFRQDEKEMNERINSKLWNEELGIYCSRFWNNDDGTPGKFLTRITPMNFYPLICGAPTPDRAKRVLAVMTDPQQFWGEWILPTVSKKDPLYFEQRYWHGTIWGPVNYLVYQGVKRYAPAEVQAEYAQKSVHLFMNNWLGTGQCGENFLSLNGRVGGNPNYTWGSLLCLIGVESVIDIDDNGKVIEGPGYNEPVTLENIPVNGKPTRAVLPRARSH
jgi:glycogen debranching enzyme